MNDDSKIYIWAEHAIAKAQLITVSKISKLTEAYNRLSRLHISHFQPSHDSHSSAMAASDVHGQGPIRGWGVADASTEAVGFNTLIMVNMDIWRTDETKILTCDRLPSQN